MIFEHLALSAGTLCEELFMHDDTRAVETDQSGQCRRPLGFYGNGHNRTKYAKSIPLCRSDHKVGSHRTAKPRYVSPVTWYRPAEQVFAVSLLTRSSFLMSWPVRSFIWCVEMSVSGGKSIAEANPKIQCHLNGRDD